MRYGSAGLSTTRIGLADQVRLLAQTLRRQPDCEAPSDAWGLALDAAGMDRPAPEYRLLLPSRQLPAVEDAATSDPRLQEEPESVPEAEALGDDMPSSQRPRLQAPPVLAVVAADFEPAAGQANAVERAQGLAPLSSEDYGPTRPLEPEPWIPLAPRTRWWPSLRRFAPQVPAGADLPRLVSQFAHGRLPRRLPRLQRRGRFRSLLVLEDARRCMRPYRRDIEMLLDSLRAQQQAVRISVEKFSGLPPPVTAGVDAVLVLSDLGLCATPDPVVTADAWTCWARALAVRDITVQAWVPVSAQRIPAALARAVPCVPWHEDSRFRPSRGHPGIPPACSQQRDAWMARMWPLLSIAQRIEPALLRRARLLAGGQGQPEWEGALWHTSDEHAAGERVLQFWPARVPEWRRRFSQLSIVEQLQVWRMFTEQHGHLARSTLVVERLIWGAYAHSEALDALREPLVEAEDWLRRMTRQEAENSAAHRHELQAGADHALHSGFLHGLVARNGVDVAFTARYVENYASLALAVGRMEGAGVTAEAWMRALSLIGSTVDEHVYSLELHYRQNGVFIEKWINRPMPGDLTSSRVPRLVQLLPQRARYNAIWCPSMPEDALHVLSTSQSAVPGHLHYSDAHGLYRLQLGYLRRADWQHALGCDCYGVFCEVQVKTMRLRFRYIPPGTFFQGSPQGVGHANEHPQHPVTHNQSLWLAETPCTQTLWKAVMGKNPSHFKRGEDAPLRPVEQVSWDDVDAFLSAFQRLLPRNCEAVLPTESQWEYACRAGTDTEYWWSNEPSDAQANWNEEHGGTTSVYRYPPNPWGLYDMHGNVWEWCADGRLEYPIAPERDQDGSDEDDVRVARGGSWADPSAYARAAFRGWWLRGYAPKSQGFRVALRSSNEHQDLLTKLLRRNGEDAGLSE